MAYNKSKHLDAAQKYLQQGKLPQAIAEYQQILKNEPKDQVTLMTLGDLFVRQGETFQALEYFERLAKIFLNDGFTTKAIAIYKKVAKLAPEESRPMERLAELYVQQGVLSEARPIYLQLAEVHLKAGRQPQAAVLLRKLLEAEPDNLRVQTRLAELHLSMGQKKEAIETFHSAMQRVLDQGDHAEAIRLADRILQLDPAHQATFLLKVRALSASGKSADAAKSAGIAAGPGCGRRNDGDVAGAVFGKRPGGKSRRAGGTRFCAGTEALCGGASRRRTRCSNPAIWIARGTMLALVRDTMIDSGEHEALAQSISRLAEKRPGPDRTSGMAGGSVRPGQRFVPAAGRAGAARASLRGCGKRREGASPPTSSFWNALRKTKRRAANSCACAPRRASIRRPEGLRRR